MQDFSEDICMSTEPSCPKCAYQYTYQDGPLWICPECNHEWNLQAAEAPAAPTENVEVVKDAHGNILVSGDTVTVIKDLKVKGASSMLKAGTKVKNIRLVESNDGHNISCRIEGFGAMNLKSEFVKK